ncbi:winged helix-turn-helix domain-containing protein [Stenotrophomonas sp. GZD-301]|uniref:winged helix-turn-helix domain-containing protein n=1 Tax=Stenotrophomonas sp. GZD-301 TaxID=3404814 RepID=UPI003BB67B74
MALLPIPVRFGPYCYQDKPPQVEAGGKTSALTPSEARLLEVLLLRAGQVVGRAELLSAVAPLQSDERAVDRAVCRLRRKLSAVDEPHANILRTARRRGYIIHAGRSETRTMR